MKKLYVFLCVVVTLVFCTNICFENILAAYDLDTYDEVKTEKLINAREMNIIISRLEGVTDNMVKSDYIQNIESKSFPKDIETTFSKRELGYYKLLYQIFDNYSKTFESNQFKVKFEEYQIKTAEYSDFILTILATKGIVGPYDYLLFKGKELGYIDRKNDEKATTEFMAKLSSLDNIYVIIDSYLNDKGAYYYNEKEFLKGNTEPIKNTEQLTNYEILTKMYGFKNKQEIYDFALKDIVFSDNVKREKMVESLDLAIGYTGEKFDQLLKDNKLVMPYFGYGRDVSNTYSMCLIAFGKYYFNLQSDDVCYSYSKDGEDKNSYTIKAQEFVTGKEVLGYMQYYLDRNGYDSSSIKEISKCMPCEDLISREDFEKVINAFKQDLGKQ